MADHRRLRYQGGRLRKLKVPFVSFNDFEAYVLRNFTNPTGRKRRRTKREQAERDLIVAALGLAGESGEVVDHFKKIIRSFDADPASYPADKQRMLLLEFGDVLHYFTYLVHRAGLTLPQIMAANIAKLNRRYAADARRKAHVSAKRVRSPDKPKRRRAA